MRTVAIVSTKQPATNPRMRKSADALTSAGFEVTVLYAHTTTWGDQADLDIFQSAKWNPRRIGGHPTDHPISYFFQRVKSRIGRILGIRQLELCPALNNYIRHLNKIKPDLVIGHNPGALPILKKWKLKTNGEILFDAEDFHRGESYWVGVGREKTMIELEDETFQLLKCITCASPLISKEYRKLYPHLHAVTVNNAFTIQLLQPKPKAITGPLTLIWFSQVLGLDRGLKELLKGIATIPQIPIILTLVGTSQNEKRQIIRNYIQSEIHEIQFIDPTPEKNLLNLLAEHEIGLALEIGEPKNRDICRTNKLYTYPLAGCFMFASQTTAQQEFFREWPETGLTIDINDKITIQSSLIWAFSNRNLLREKRIQAWTTAQHKLNWEYESQQLINTVNGLLE